LNYIIKKINQEILNQLKYKSIRNLPEIEQHNKLKEKFKIIDDILYGNNNELAYKTNKIIYKLAIYLSTKSEYNFIWPKQLLTLILSPDYFGLYNFNVIVFTGSEIDTQPNFFIEKKSFDEKTVKKLKIYYERLIKKQK
jgi:hypothetical protein